MSNSLNIALLNAFPLLETSAEEQAHQKSIEEYVIVGGLSVLIWDILTHLHADYQLFLRHRTKFPTWIYLLSRWSTLLYGLVCAIFITATIENCAALARVKCAVYHVTISSTALLFFLRVRAIFNRNRRVTLIFFALWLVVLGGSMTAVISISGSHIGNTEYCVFSDVKSYLTAIANISLAVFDTSVFIAITWSLSTSHLTDKKNAFGGKADLFGTYLPAFTKALLQDGQKYYMVAMMSNILVLIMEFVPGVPPSYRAIFLAPAIEITNIMACRVFRHTKKRNNDDVVHEASTIKFGRNNNSVSVYIRTQVGRLTTTSAAEGGNNGPSVAHTEVDSKEAANSGRVSKEVISVV